MHSTALCVSSDQGEHSVSDSLVAVTRLAVSVITVHDRGFDNAASCYGTKPGCNVSAHIYE